MFLEKEFKGFKNIVESKMLINKYPNNIVIILMIMAFGLPANLCKRTHKIKIRIKKKIKEIYLIKNKQGRKVVKKCNSA